MVPGAQEPVERRHGAWSPGTSGATSWRLVPGNQWSGVMVPGAREPVERRHGAWSPGTSGAASWCLVPGNQRSVVMAPGSPVALSPC